MGANAQTAVPVFTAGQVLTAVQQTQINTGIPVFATTVTRDAAFGGAGEKTLAEGQFAYIEASNEVQYYDGAAWAKLGGTMTNVTVFTASGTFTPPAGVTYAIAHMLAGGGGVGTASSGTGGTSSVAFAAGTISAIGGIGMNGTNSALVSFAGQANSGQGARSTFFSDGGNDSEFLLGGNGAEIVAGGTVTPAVGITVTVGAGGVAGTSGSAGGSGYVWIEYQV